MERERDLLDKLQSHHFEERMNSLKTPILEKRPAIELFCEQLEEQLEQIQNYRAPEFTEEELLQGIAFENSRVHDLIKTDSNYSAFFQQFVSLN